MLGSLNRQLTNSLLALAVLTTLPGAMAKAATVANPICPAETANFDPGNGEISSCRLASRSRSSPKD